MRGCCCMHTGPQRGTHFFGQIYKGGKAVTGSQWTCLHVLMYVNILTKVWNQKENAWHMHAGPDRGAHLCTQLCIGGGAYMNSHVDMHTCTDACTHSNQGVAPDEGLMEMHIGLHVCMQLCKGSRADMGS